MTVAELIAELQKFPGDMRVTRAVFGSVSTPGDRVAVEPMRFHYAGGESEITAMIYNGHERHFNGSGYKIGPASR